MRPDPGEKDARAGHLEKAESWGAAVSLGISQHRLSQKGQRDKGQFNSCSHLGRRVTQEGHVEKVKKHKLNITDCT